MQLRREIYRTMVEKSADNTIQTITHIYIYLYIYIYIFIYLFPELGNSILSIFSEIRNIITFLDFVFQSFNCYKNIFVKYILSKSKCISHDSILKITENPAINI